MIDEMRAFVLLAETGSIHRTAERIPLTQPAVSRQIQRLELALGTTLLDRRSRPPRLTPAGQIVLQRCRRILADIADLKSVAGGEPEGPLRIGIVHVLEEAGVAETLGALRDRFPKLQPEIVGGWSVELLNALERGRLDVAIVLRERPVGPDESCARAIGVESFVAVAARESAIPNEPSLPELAAEPWILSAEPCHARGVLRAAFRQAGRDVRMAAEVHNLELQQALIGRGLGLGLLPLRRLRRPGARRGLRVLRTPGLTFDLAITLAHAPHLGALEPAVDMVYEDFRRRFGPATAPQAEAKVREEAAALCGSDEEDRSEMGG